MLYNDLECGPSWLCMLQGSSRTQASAQKLAFSPSPLCCFPKFCFRIETTFTLAWLDAITIPYHDSTLDIYIYIHTIYIVHSYLRAIYVYILTINYSTVLVPQELCRLLKKGDPNVTDTEATSSFLRFQDKGRGFLYRNNYVSYGDLCFVFFFMRNYSCWTFYNWCVWLHVMILW